MELTLTRKFITKQSTIGQLDINGIKECLILEDTDRGLHQNMTTDEIKKHKVYGQTAIPKGRYEVIINYSERFKVYMPLLLSVPGYEGVRIHPGNTKENTLGCLLPGTEGGVDIVKNSRKAYVALLAKMKVAEKKEKIFITIK